MLVDMRNNDGSTQQEKRLQLGYRKGESNA